MTANWGMTYVDEGELEHAVSDPISNALLGYHDTISDALIKIIKNMLAKELTLHLGMHYLEDGHTVMEGDCEISTWAYGIKIDFSLLQAVAEINERDRWEEAPYVYRALKEATKLLEKSWTSEQLAWKEGDDE